MAQIIEFFFDFGSPYSYLAYSQLRHSDADVVPRPMRVLQLMDIVGNVPTTLVCEAKGKYARADLLRWTQRYGLILNPSREMKAQDFVSFAHAVLAAANPVEADMITLGLFQAIWSEGKTLSTRDAVLSEIAQLGIDTAPLSAGMDAPATAARLEANTLEAAERGAFGSPSIFIGDSLYFGNDRLDFVHEHLARLQEAA